MSAPDLSADLMMRLRESGAEKHTTLLLGAGASTTSGLPDWDELTTRLLLGSDVVSDSDTARVLLERQDPLLVVEAARAAYGAAWEDKIRQALYNGVETTEFSPLHLAAVAHALGAERSDTSLVTLNFDTLLEDALGAEVGQPVRSVSDSAAIPSEWAVHHLHGIVSPSRTCDLVLSLTDFLDVIARDHSWQRQYLSSALQRGAVVVAGTSYRDPDVRQWLHAAMRWAPAEHAALVLLSRQGFGISRSQFHELRQALIRQWEAVGFRPILLHDYSDAAQVIRELRHVNDTDYVAPGERARALWHVHQQRFADLQDTYVHQLRDDSSSLRGAFDVPQLNLSLWLSDGQGKLERWAASDRIQLNPMELRRIDTGYDSPWIAGKSLSADTLLIQDTEHAGTGRWKSVLALPIPVTHPKLPTMSSAVLTIGLPERSDRYASSKLLWGTSLSEIADHWTSQLSATLQVS